MDGIIRISVQNREILCNRPIANISLNTQSLIISTWLLPPPLPPTLTHTHLPTSDAPHPPTPKRGGPNHTFIIQSTHVGLSGMPENLKSLWLTTGCLNNRLRRKRQSNRQFDFYPSFVAGYYVIKDPGWDVQMGESLDFTDVNMNI